MNAGLVGALERTSERAGIADLLDDDGIHLLPDKVVDVRNLFVDYVGEALSPADASAVLDGNAAMLLGIPTPAAV